MLCFTPYSLSMVLYEALVYWLPRSEWSTAPQNSVYAAAVFSTVAAHNSALMLSSIDSPIAVGFSDSFCKNLPVSDELSSLPTGMSRVKIDCYLTAINPGTGDHHLEKLPADEYDRLVRNITVTMMFILNASICLKFCGFYSENRLFSSQL